MILIWIYSVFFVLFCFGIIIIIIYIFDYPVITICVLLLGKIWVFFISFHFIIVEFAFKSIIVLIPMNALFFFCCISLLKYLTLIIIIITRPIRIQWWLLSFSFSLYFFLWKPPLFFFNSIHHHLHHVWTNIQDDDDDDGEKRFDMDSWEIFLLYTHTHSLSSSLLIFNANTLCVATFFLMMND